MIASLMNSAPGGTIAGVIQRGSGYQDGDLFKRWLQHFITIAGCTLESPHILLLDGHVSHKRLDAIKFARAHGLHIVTFPPYCTHRFQPLDRTLFRCLKTSYSRACDSWLLPNRGRAITHHDVMPIFRQAYVNSAIMQVSVNGSAVSGIWPLNEDKFNDELNALETATLVQPAVRDEHDAAIQPAVRDEHDAAIQPAVRNEHDAAIQPAVRDKQDAAIQPDVRNEHDAAIQPAVRDEHDAAIQPAVRDENDAAIQPAVRNEPGADIQPVVHDVVAQAMMTLSPPQAKKTRTVPSTSIASVLTSSPYKKMVIEKISEKKGTKELIRKRPKPPLLQLLLALPV